MKEALVLSSSCLENKKDGFGCKIRLAILLLQMWGPISGKSKNGHCFSYCTNQSFAML